MYAALVTTEFGLGADEPRAADYLVTGSRIQVWVSLTSLPWWSAGLGLLGAALIAYRTKQAKAWAAKAKEVLNGDVFTNVSATYSQGAGSVSIMATTTVDFAREAHAPGRVIEVLRNAGLDPVEEKWKIIQRPGGKKETALLNTPNPDNSGANNNSGTPPSGEGLLDKLALVLGTTTGVLLLGGGLLAFIVLKNK